MLNLHSKKIKKGHKMSLNEYYSEIRSDIAKEFGFEAIGYGKNKVTLEQVTNAQRLFHSLPIEKQNELVNNYFMR